jgi:hypothetical protein
MVGGLQMGSGFLLITAQNQEIIHIKMTVIISDRETLLSSLLHVNVYVTHNLLNVLVQIANQMEFKRKKIVRAAKE